MTTHVSAQPLATASSQKIGLRIFSTLLSVCVLGLLLLGATVKSHEAGLSVPDWPTSYGYSMFTFPMSQWIGGIFYEHVHRLLASLVGFLTVLLVAWTWWADSRRSVRMLTMLALLAVIAQGILGGLTVKYQLPLSISTMHGMLGQIFFCITVAIAFANSETYNETTLIAASLRPAVFRGAIVLLVILTVQLFLGNLVRHSDAGLAITDFPTMAGSYVPSISTETMTKLNATRATLHLAPVTPMQVLFHLLHRAWVFVVLAGFLALIATFLRSSASMRRQTKAIVATLGSLLVVQVILGSLVILSLRTPIIASLHVATGALLLATTLYLALRSARTNAP